MTASQIARQLHGVKAGKRWMCRCPVSRMHQHGDRSRSMSVWEAADGWVCVKCFAGCTRDEILAAMGLKVRDLALNDRPNPKQAAEMEKIRVQAERERNAIKAEVRRLAAQALYWANRRNDLGKQLAESIDSDKLASLFHRACARAAELDAAHKEKLCRLYPKIKAFNL